MTPALATTARGVAYAEPAPRAPRASIWVARVVSWPLALLVVLAGAAWRVLALAARAVRWGGHPDRGAPEGLRRLGAFLTQGGRYLAFRSTELPRWNGVNRKPGESFGTWHDARVRLARSRITLWAWTGLALYLSVGLAVQLGWLAQDAGKQDSEAVYVAPGWLHGSYFLGSDRFGQSVGQMALKGVAVALWVGTVAAVLSCFVGAVLGALAGFFGGWVDACVVWLYTTLESIPELLLVLAFAFTFKTNVGLRDGYDASFLKQTLGLSLGLFTIVLGIGLISWTGVCRQVRGEFIRQRELDYVTAARALGIPTRRIIFRHILPNAFHLLLISFSLLFIGAIKYEVVLTFLGVGVETGEASWGRMINDAKVELLRDPPAWWQLTAATSALFGLVLCVNLFTDALRDVLDPRTRT